MTFKERQKLDFLTDHGLGLDHLGGPAGLHDPQHRGAGLLGGCRPVHLGAVGLQLRLDLGQVGVEVLEDVLLHLAGPLAEPVGIGEMVGKQLRALFVRGLGAEIDGGPLVGGHPGRKFVDGLAGHGRIRAARRS